MFDYLFLSVAFREPLLLHCDEICDLALEIVLLLGLNFLFIIFNMLVCNRMFSFKIPDFLSLSICIGLSLRALLDRDAGLLCDCEEEELEPKRALLIL